jgi:hypothetical protein
VKEKEAAAAPIAIIDFGKVASSRATFAGGARTHTLRRERDENVMISATAISAEEPTGTTTTTTRNLWRRVKDKAFGKAHVRCGRD